MPLLQVPVEILTQMIKETMPESFENFALSCKAVYEASTPLRAKHNKLSRRYKKFKYTKLDGLSIADIQALGDDFCSSSLELLSKIADEPLIAKYIVSADFKNDDRYWEKEFIIDQTEHLKSSGVQSLLEASPYARAANISVEDAWESFISCYQSDYYHSGLSSIFLLTLLPNVTELSLPQDRAMVADFVHEEDFSESGAALLDEIVLRANDSSNLLAALSKLTSILPSTTEGYSNKWGLEIFEPFLSIKGVKSFNTGSVVAADDDGAGIPFPDIKYDSFGLDLETVELPWAWIDGPEFAMFLSRLPRLRSLKICVEFKQHISPVDVEMSSIINAIGDEVGDRLETFTFSVYHTGEYGEGDGPPCSFTKYTKLRDLELDTFVLHYNNDEDRILINLLPPSLERLCIAVQRMRETIRHTSAFDGLFNDFSALKNDRLPCLREIIFRCSNKFPVSEALELLSSSADHPGESTPVITYDKAPTPPATNPRSVFADAANTGVYLRHIEDMQTTARTNRALMKWVAELAKLGPSITVTFVPADSHNICPTFVDDYGSRFDVESRD